MARTQRASQLYVLTGVVLAFTLGYVVTTMLWSTKVNGPIHRRFHQFAMSGVFQQYVGGLAARPLNASEAIEWKLFGAELMSDQDLRNMQHAPHVPVLERGGNNADSAYHHGSSRVLLEAVSKSFQEQLHLGTPLSCHTGQEGLIPVKYKRFLRTLVDYTSFHKNSEKGTRTLVWQCSGLEHCGGLVDRLKGITYALLLAMFSRRKLILNWDSVESTFFTPNLIDWTVDRVFNRTLNMYDAQYQMEQPEWKGLADWPVMLHMFSILGGTGVENSEYDLEYIFQTIRGEAKTVVLATNLEPCSLQSGVKTAHQKWVQKGLQWTGLSSLSPNDVDKVLGIAFRYLFQTKPELLEEVVRARNVLGLDSRPYTGVHIRSGFAGSSDYQENVQHPKLVRNMSIWEDTLKCAISTADTLLGNNSLLFFATDSELVKHLAVSKYGARIRTLDNTLVHIDRMHKKHLTSEDEREGVLAGLVDFFVLAEAYSHVRGSSGFPWAAGLLCSLPGERVIDGLKCVPENGHS